MFVDESKEKGYLVTAAAFLPGDLDKARRSMRGLIMSGQKRVHFTKEGDPRRKQILDAIFDLQPRVTLYDASRIPRREQRGVCLDAMVEDLASFDTRMLVLERDDSLVEVDKRLLYRRVRELGCAETLTYRHQRTSEEPLLMIPDAIAWCWSRGGQWKTRVRSLVAEVCRL